MQLGLVVGTAGKGTEMDICRPFIRQCGDAQLTKDMDPIRGNSYPHLMKVIGSKARELGVAEMLDGSEVLYLMLYPGLSKRTCEATGCLHEGN